MAEPFLFTALDNLSKKERETLETAEKLNAVEGSFGFKVNLDYLLNPILSTKTVIYQFQQRFKRPVFADLKMWNGSRTMETIVEMLVEAEVDYLNVYALADNQLPAVVKMTEGSKTKVLGLTVLTHYDDAYCQRHFRRSLRDTVKHFAEVALEQGCHGIILPGTALDVVRHMDTIKVVPGVRPKWYEDTRHQQEIEPRVAVQQGADIIVCGSPIMKSQDKVGALKQVLSEMNEA